MPAEAVLLGRNNDLFRQRLDELNIIAKRMGYAVEVKLVDSQQPIDAVVAECGNAIALITGTFGDLRLFTHSAFVELVRRLPKVKLVQASSAGTDHVDKAALAALGVAVANHGGANAPAVAEHTVMMMVAVLRKVPLQLTSVLAGTWSRPLTSFPESDFRTLVGKQVGLVGLGRIGSGVARRLQGWECRVVYHDVIEFTSSYERELSVTRVDFDSLLATSDVVSLHVPLETSTFHMMSDTQLARMKPTAILINTCRGGVVDEVALAKALREKVISGAGLDVLETEPMPKEYPLAALPNVMITPHAATRAVESTDNAKLFMIQNIERVGRGELPQSVVHPSGP